jgi:hypothetical protein
MAWRPRSRRAKDDPVGSQDRHNHQTTRLGKGKHDAPGPVVCVMELASMLAGERFGDRPSSVCPVIGAILRSYNDVIDDERRVDLYRYAAESVGTRGDFSLQHRRAEIALRWAGPGYATRRRRRGGLYIPPGPPDPDSGPDGIAEYVIGSLRRRHSDSAHSAMLWLLDELIGVADRSVEEEWLELPAPRPALLVERAAAPPDEWLELPLTGPAVLPPAPPAVVLTAGGVG